MAAKPTSGKRNRYLGVQPFRKGDRHLFFGRDEDIENLHDFILLEKIVVLFGKSGYGKSSLLSAGVLPRLTDEAQPAAYRFRTVEARFGNYVEGNSFTPLETLRRILEKEMPGSASDLTDLTNFQNLSNLSPSNLSPSLWKLFKQRQFSIPENPKSEIGNPKSASPTQFLLVFDQFEEFFSYPAEQQEAFRRQLAELLYTDVPQQVRENLDALSPEARSRMATPMNVKAVFSIRSDRMSHLDSMKDALPTILHKRYELRPLTRSQAEAAIVMPARLGHDAAGSWQEQYATPPFEYERPALDAMLGSLALESGGGSPAAGVEAFLLQILCDKVESLVLEGKLPDLDGNGLPDVTADALPDMANLLEDYTQRKLDELDPAQRPAARRLLEDGLLAEDALSGEGRRTSVDGKALLAQFRQHGLSQALLDDLERTYLLRREPNTVGGFSYEISHDRLVAPVQKMKKERLAAEEKARLAKRQRRLMGIIALVALVAGGAIALAAWAFGQKNEAVKAKEATQEALQKAEKLVSAFYFYADRFALAYGEKDEYNVFYFIDKNGDEVGKLGRWEKAEQFEWTGFAKVKKYESDRWTDYLLDTLGNAYPVAYDLKDLNKNITALDLSGKGLDALPVSLFQHTQLKVLLLIGNELTRLPGEIGQLKSLTKLDLSGNGLTSLPREISQLKSLTELDLSVDYFNPGQLKSLPEEIGQLQSLSRLDLMNNQLTSLPGEIGQLKSLTELNLMNNRLTSLPAEIGQLISLSSLDLSGNDLTDLPGKIGQLQSLSSLDLSDNQLTSLPVEFWQIQSLRSLDLSLNQLTNLPGEIGQLKRLTMLRWGGNQLRSLPVELWQLQSLISLDLSFNQLTSLPREIGQLQSLTSLDLGTNQLRNLPVELGQLQSLISLDLSGNQLRNLPVELGQLKSLNSLNLTYNPLKSLPGVIWQLKSLNSLYLRGIGLTSLPGEIGQLKSLTNLYLGFNGLTSLPAELWQLKNLSLLDLSYNPLKSLSGEIWHLKNLSSLDFSGNQLTNLPEVLWVLQRLTELNLSENRLTSLPAEIGQLKSLTSLYLNDNKLTSLPQEIRQLKSLIALGLGGNQLTSLPVEIGQLQSLTGLDLINNPIPKAEQEKIRQLLPGCEISF